MSRVGPIGAVVAVVVVLGLGPRGLGADLDPSVVRGLQYLRGHLVGQRVGEAALIGLSLIKAETPESDPALAACVKLVRARFANVYTPDRTGGTDIYEAAVVAMLLANLEGGPARAELGMIASFLISRQNANGSWDYSHRAKGDTSISQYAVLGLWEAENGGASVPPQVWERAASWFLSVQSQAGSWNYHRDETGPETIAMTAAGVGSLLICHRQLSQYRRTDDAPSSLLIPLKLEGTGYEVHVATLNRIDQGVKRGMAWLAANFTTTEAGVIGQTPYYALYGIERIAALADKDTIGKLNWLDRGRKFILSTQAPNGSWTAQHGTEMNTVWAILFLTRSTAKSLRRIEVKRLGAGTLLGGRGLPHDLSSLTVAAGKVVSRPMNGAVEGMLAALEDPRAQSADSALSGLVSRYEAQGPKALRPYKDRFRKMMTDRDPGLRNVAAWALGRTGDLDAIPTLIDALTDPEESVVDQARLGLQLLSRKIHGPGPPSPSTPEQRREAARKWREWYNTIRPLNLEGQDDELAATESAPRSPQ